ncbi:hypothetical protein BS78_05G260400 [Paspalum vaginatum]|nr:hypothetical protein BS78_05G260400 [Paspalum vaginatum]
MAAVGRRPSLLVLFSLYCLLSTLSIHVRRAASVSFNLQFSKPQSPADLSQLINCRGDANVSSDTLELTRNKDGQASTYSTGRANYAYPVPLWDGATGEMACFTTNFSFRITPDPSSPYPGDGMAFFLGHFENWTLLPGGGYLGLIPPGGFTNASAVVAVEFDAYLNPEFNDSSYSHVGIDINSVNSTAVTDTTSQTKNLTSGYTMVATVRYENVSKLLAVELKINSTSYAVNTTVDLRSYLPQQVAVGFSAATGTSSELHQRWASFYGRNARDEDREYHMEPLRTTATVMRSKVTSRAGLISILERGVAASGPRRYTYRELAAAIDNFAEEGRLGRGGFGSVYRGKLMISAASGQDEERPVAIKVFSSESSAQGRKEFEAEVRIISRLKHRNLVQLLGWCDSRSGLLLVYELLAGGSLDRHLHSRDDRLLTWPERYQIILGLGSALRYLHQEWEQCVVHGDIKPSNIMLDEWHGTKLGDFGLARLGDHGARWQTTKAVLGTAGYIDPEFVNTRHPSTESDVYSFGIVLLEIVSGRAPVVLPEPGSGGPPFVLLKWVWGLYGRNKILDAVDERLRAGGNEVDNRCMERALVVGLW